MNYRRQIIRNIILCDKLKCNMVVTRLDNVADIRKISSRDKLESMTRLICGTG